MDEILQHIQSPLFLFTIVVASFVGILSNFATKTVERRWGAFTEGRAEKLRRRSEARQRYVEAMAADDDAFHQANFRELRLWMMLVLASLIWIGLDPHTYDPADPEWFLTTLRLLRLVALGSLGYTSKLLFRNQTELFDAYKLRRAARRRRELDS